MTARIPEGMSSVDAFDALYKNAEVLGMGRLNPAAGKAASTPWNAIQIFKTYCHNGYCDYVRGKCMKVDFRKFPELDVSSYDKQYGQGSAQKAIDTYQRTIDESNSKEKYDLNCSPCTYFNSYWKQKTPENQRADLDGMFNKCEQLEESEKRIQKQIEETTPSLVFNKCKAKYALVSPPVNYIDHDYKPCQEALDHFKMLLGSKRHEDTNVEGLSICRYNGYLPFLQRCQRQSSEVSLETARKILEAQTTKD